MVSSAMMLCGSTARGNFYSCTAPKQKEKRLPACSASWCLTAAVSKDNLYGKWPETIWREMRLQPTQAARGSPLFPTWSWCEGSLLPSNPATFNSASPKPSLLERRGTSRCPGGVSPPVCAPGGAEPRAAPPAPSQGRGRQLKALIKFLMRSDLINADIS